MIIFLRTAFSASQTNVRIKFLFFGALNTICSYALFYLFNQIFIYDIAYAIAYAAGIVISYSFNSLFVFRSPLKTTKFISYPLIYIAQYLISAALLRLSVEIIGLNSNLAPALMLIATVPISFILNKYFFLRSKN